MTNLPDPIARALAPFAPPPSDVAGTGPVPHPEAKREISHADWSVNVPQPPVRTWSVTTLYTVEGEERRDTRSVDAVCHEQATVLAGLYLGFWLAEQGARPWRVSIVGHATVADSAAPETERAAPAPFAPPDEPCSVRSVLIECERWLDGVRQERDRDRFEKRWNDLQDDAAWLAHIARKVLAVAPAPVVRWCVRDGDGLDVENTYKSREDASLSPRSGGGAQIIRVEIREVRG